MLPPLFVPISNGPSGGSNSRFFYKFGIVTTFLPSPTVLLRHALNFCLAAIIFQIHCPFGLTVVAGLSVLCQRRCAFRWELRLYTLWQPGMWQLCFSRFLSNGTPVEEAEINGGDVLVVFGKPVKNPVLISWSLVHFRIPPPHSNSLFRMPFPAGWGAQGLPVILQPNCRLFAPGEKGNDGHGRGE